MDITQAFYDDMAASYDKLFEDWDQTTRDQATILDGIFRSYGISRNTRVLDCACGIGTQAIGLAALGYAMSASDISANELQEAARRAEERGLSLRLAQADFRALDDAFPETFDAVIAMDNALPHMLTADDLAAAVASIVGRVRSGGIFVASIRDYDHLLTMRPTHSTPYIHKSSEGQRVSFQTWDWTDDIYHLTQYIIEDEGTLTVSKFACAYRATRRDELDELLHDAGCSDVSWLQPSDSGFYQPIVVARR